MAQYYVAYSKSIRYIYKANLRSNVTLFLILNAFFCFVLPLIITYNSNGFWIRQHSFREQPTIKFKYQYLLVLEYKSDNYGGSSIICTTSPEINRQHSFLNDNCTLLKIMENDENEDGRNDQFNLLLHVVNVSQIDITTVRLFLIFNYRIHNECVFETDVMTATTLTFAQPIGRLNIEGELETNVKIPIECVRRANNKKNNISLTDFTLVENDKFYFLDSIISYLAKMPVNANLKNFYYTTKRKDEIAVNEPMIVKTSIKYTEQTIVYRTKFWQLIKWAWIQYFSILALFIFLSKKIKKFVFQNRILQTIRVNSLETNKNF